MTALFGVGEGADAGGAARFGACPRYFVKGERRAGAEHQKVVTQGLAIGEGNLLFARLQSCQGRMNKVDSLFLHMGFDGDRGLLALPPLDGNPRIGWGEFKVRLVVDEDHLMLLAQFGLEFVGGGHAPQTRAYDDYRCHVQPPAFNTRSCEQGHPTRLFQSHPFEDHRCRAETGEGALDQVDPDKGAQPDKTRMNPGGKDQREQQHATRDDSDSVIYCHSLSSYLF